MEVDPENATVVKGESGSASGVSEEEEADANGVLCKGTQVMRSFQLSAKVLKQEDHKRISSCRALLDGGATCILRPAVSKEEYAGGSAVWVETATEKVTLRRINKATVITNTPAQLILPLGQLVQRGFLMKWDLVGLRWSTRVERLRRWNWNLPCPWRSQRSSFPSSRLGSCGRWKT